MIKYKGKSDSKVVKRYYRVIIIETIHPEKLKFIYYLKSKNILLCFNESTLY